MMSDPESPRQQWQLLALTLFTFFFLLGGRSLNEPDEGRYAEIAREMIELNDWLAPHLWYAPHLEKPPLTYWTVAVSMLVFGRNEWAVRLPVALAAISGVWASYLLGRGLGGARAGLWSALILQSSLLYFVMGRMLTTDMLLTQFIAWAVYFFWRSWRSLGGDGLDSRGKAKRFFAWQLASWTAVALGFLTKGPIALVVPMVCVATLAIRHGREVANRKMLLAGAGAGLFLCVALVAPWFWLIFERFPLASQFMIFGQLVGHTLGTTVKNRQGHPLYYFVILGVGFLPWTVLLGWLWRRAHWRQLNAAGKDAWALLSAWVLLPFVVFSLMGAKLPAYILPLFPALAVMVALRYFGAGSDSAQPPGWAWRVCMTSALVLMVVIPLAVPLIFRVAEPPLLNVQAALAVVALGLSGWRGRAFSPGQCAFAAVVLGLLNLELIAAGAPLVETGLKSNQTLKPLGLALQQAWRPGVTLVCWGRLPQGLPFYAHPVVAATRQPYLGGMPLDGLPFEFPGNRERFGNRLVPDETAMIQLLSSDRPVLAVGFSGSFGRFQRLVESKPLALLACVGRWELFANYQPEKVGVME